MGQLKAFPNLSRNNLPIIRRLLRLFAIFAVGQHNVFGGEAILLAAQ